MHVDFLGVDRGVNATTIIHASNTNAYIMVQQKFDAPGQFPRAYHCDTCS